MTTLRRRFLGLCIALGFFPRRSPAAARGAPYFGHGIMAGEVTSSTVLLQSRLTQIPSPQLDEEGDMPGAPGVACFEYSSNAAFTGSTRTPWSSVHPDSDFIIRSKLTRLQPDTVYHYRILAGADQSSAQPGLTGRFTTLPGTASEKDISFIVGSCMNYNKFMFGLKGKANGPLTATEEDKRLGYPSFAAMSALKPAFFVGTGDIVYYDNILHGPARTLPELRKCWHEQFRFPRLIEFLSQTPAYWSKDDHDFRFNESDNSGDALPLPRTGIEVFREQLPIHPAGDITTPTYRTHRVTNHLQIWLTEGRDYRSPNEMDDGPNKSLWGKAQREWLQRTLKESDATWKILISPTPMVGPDDATKIDNHADLGGFRHEANAFFTWLKAENITGFMIFCGDRHWQYHSIHPSGVEEFACGALNDENARLGVPPGSEKGTDPEGLIRQPYLSPKPAGGFLRTRVTSDGNLIIDHHDATGRVMNSVTKAH